MALIALATVSVLALIGCSGPATSEIKNTDQIGLAEGVPTGTTQSGYGDGKGDSVGSGGAGAAQNADDVNAGKGGEHEGGGSEHGGSEGEGH